MEKLEIAVKKLESQMTDVVEGLELIKTYGFQPTHFEELLKKSRGLSQNLPGADLVAKVSTVKVEESKKKETVEKETSEK